MAVTDGPTPNQLIAALKKVSAFRARISGNPKFVRYEHLGALYEGYFLGLLGKPSLASKVWKRTFKEFINFLPKKSKMRVESSIPLLLSATAFTPGHYTWEAWAVIDGLDRELGERDFQIVDDDLLRARIRGLPDEVALRLLHTAGFQTDARHLARRLPPTAERDAYLSDLPAR